MNIYLSSLIPKPLTRKKNISLFCERPGYKTTICLEKICVYRTHLNLCPPFLPIRLSYKYGGGLIMVISLIYMPLSSL